MLFKRLALKKFFSSIRKGKNVDTSASLPAQSAEVEGAPKKNVDRGPCMCRKRSRRPCHGETMTPILASTMPKMCVPGQQSFARNQQTPDASLTHYFRDKIEPTIHTYRQASGVRCSCCKRIPTHSSKVYYGNIYCEPCLHKLILNQQLENPLHYSNVKVDKRENSESKLEFIGNMDYLMPKDFEPEDMKCSCKEKCCCKCRRGDCGEVHSGFPGPSGGVLPPAPPQPASTRYKERTKYVH